MTDAKDTTEDEAPVTAAPMVRHGDEFDPDVPGSAPHSPHLIDGTPDRETLIYPAAGTDQKTAQALLKAAEDLGYPPSVVNWRGDAFGVPQDVADAAAVPEDGDQAEDGDESVPVVLSVTPKNDDADPAKKKAASAKATAK